MQNKTRSAYEALRGRLSGMLGEGNYWTFPTEFDTVQIGLTSESAAVLAAHLDGPVLTSLRTQVRILEQKNSELRDQVADVRAHPREAERKLEDAQIAERRLHLVGELLDIPVDRLDEVFKP